MHSLDGSIQIRARRQPPPNLNVALNLNLQLPPGLTQQQAAFQQMLQALQQQVLQQAQQAVAQALKDQAPVLGVEASFRGGLWKRSD